MKSMVERSKELGKDIPDEIMVWIYDCEPRGIRFFERNKEWFPDMFKEKEDNTERVFQFQTRQFPVTESLKEMKNVNDGIE